MAEKQERARLEDVISYKPDQYLDEGEIRLIKDHFKDNPALLRVLRKILLPTISDPELPVEEFGKDMWLVGADWGMFTAEETKAVVLARQLAIKFICGGFISLKQITTLPEENTPESVYKRTKDSSK